MNASSDHPAHLAWKRKQQEKIDAQWESIVAGYHLTAHDPHDDHAPQAPTPTSVDHE